VVRPPGGRLGWLEREQRRRTRGYAAVRRRGATGAGGGAGGGDGHGASPWGAGGCPVCPLRPWGAGEGGCDRGDTFGFRESIFKISHTKWELFAHFPDTRSDVARAPLQMARVVYEGGRAESSQGRQQAGDQGAAPPAGAGPAAAGETPQRRPASPPHHSTYLYPQPPVVGPPPPTELRGPTPWRVGLGRMSGMPGHLSRRS
jgi:hypothetical protein